MTDRCTMLGMWSVDFSVQDLLDVRTKPNCYSVRFLWTGLGAGRTRTLAHPAFAPLLPSGPLLYSTNGQMI